MAAQIAFIGLTIEESSIVKRWNEILKRKNDRDGKPICSKCFCSYRQHKAKELLTAWANLYDVFHSLILVMASERACTDYDPSPILVSENGFSVNNIAEPYHWHESSGGVTIWSDNTTDDLMQWNPKTGRIPLNQFDARFGKEEIDHFEKRWGKLKQES